MNYHTHKYKFESLKENGHTHRLSGYAENMIGIGSIHIHLFTGVCSYNNHTHYYSGITGFPIRTENGHIHKMEGILETNGTHQHEFSGFTFEDTAYSSSAQSFSFSR